MSQKTGTRTLVLTLSMILVLAACGGDPAGQSDVGSPTTRAPAGGDTGPTPSETTESTTTTSSVVEDDEGVGPTESGGTVTIGDTIYFFVVDDGGTCDPNFFGTFRAFMQQVDSSGDPLVSQMAFSANADGEGLFGGELEGVQWSAGNPDDGSTIDSVEIDGDRMSGTATFVRPDTGESQAGTFDVTCVGE